MTAATLPIVLIILSIILAVVSGWYIHRCFRTLRYRLESEESVVQLYRENLRRLSAQLNDSCVEKDRIRHLLESVRTAHKRATDRVAEEKRDRLFWRSLFQQVASTLAQRNKENGQLTLERDIAIGEFNRLAKQQRATARKVRPAHKSITDLLNNS